MTKIIKGNWIMKKDEIIDEDLKVTGNISGKNGKKFNLVVKGNLNCWDLVCRDLDCWDLKCLDLNCWDLVCRDLNCWDLVCRDLIYYAVCFSYNNIICKSAKGTRNNSKMFVLDGKIIINGV